jgi:hypothetical protein
MQEKDKVASKFKSEIALLFYQSAYYREFAINY